MPPQNPPTNYKQTLAAKEGIRPKLSPTDIAQYISHSECPRLFEFQVSEEFEENHLEQYSYDAPYDPLSPVLAADGIAFESAVEQRLSARAHTHYDYTDSYSDGATPADKWKKSRRDLAEAIYEYATHPTPDGHLLITQAHLAPALGTWPLGGQADALLIWRCDATEASKPLTDTGGDTPATDDISQPHLRFCIIDAKASSEVQTYHQAQVAVYTLLLRQFLSAIPWLEPSACDTNESPKKSLQSRFHTCTDTVDVLPGDPDGVLSIPDDIDSPFSWDITGGVITRDTDLDIPQQKSIQNINTNQYDAPAVTPSELPSFDLESRELDIKNLLSDSGRFNKIWNSSPAQTRYSLGSKCTNCRHRTACFTSAVEDGTLGALGISAGEQAVLEQYDIETIADLADIAYKPTDPNPRDEPEPDIKREYQETYDSLMSDTTLSQSLHRYIIQAQSHLGLVRSSSGNALGGVRPSAIPGSRDAKLPEDDPGYDLSQYGDGLSFPQGSLIRCYLIPHTDPRFNRLAMISARVTAVNADVTETIVASPPSFPTNESEAGTTESELIRDFTTQLSSAISAVAKDLDVDGLPLHFYTFTDGDTQAITDALDRNKDLTPELDTLSDLLQSRGGIDEHVLSSVKPAISSQFALATPANGLLQYWSLLRAGSSGEALPAHSMKYERTDGTEINLRKAFTFQFFGYEAPYTSASPTPTLYPEQNADTSPDGRFPLWPTATNQVPIEYLAAAEGYLSDDFIASLGEHYDEAPPLSEFRYIDPTDDDPVELANEDVETMAGRLAHALNHIERSVDHKALATDKTAFPDDLFNEFSLGTSDLKQASMEYLHLEHDTAQSDLDDHLERPMRSRIASGRSIPMAVESAEIDEDSNNLIVEGWVAYKWFFENPEVIAHACRHSGAGEDGMGSWLVANELTDNLQPKSTSPGELKRGVPITLNTLDLNSGRISFSALPGYFYKNETEFEYYHDDWTVEASEADNGTVLFEKNSVFILDERPDDLTSQRIYEALSDSKSGGFAADFINSLLTDTPTTPGEPEPIPTTDRFPDRGIEAFIDWASNTLEFEPNDAQKAFARENTSQLVALQGPPGTGKTSGALAPALLSRLFAAGVDGDSTISLVVAESNKAIDEALEDVASTYVDYQSSPLYTASSDATATDTRVQGATTQASEGINPIEFDTDLIRLVGTPPREEKQLEGVSYLSYNEDDQTSGGLSFEDIATRIRDNQTAQHTLSEHGAGTAPIRNPDPEQEVDGQTTLTGLFGAAGDEKENEGTQGKSDGQSGGPLPASATGTSNRPHTMIFTTPARLYKLIDNLDPDTSPVEWLDEQVGFFDLVAVDEASMTSLPSFLLAGAFARPSAQFLLSGDHRQMPPIRKHEWEGETRRTILEYAGNLSLLDFVRLLRGDLPLDTVEEIDADTLLPELRDIDYDVPLIQLPEGYRSHKQVTDFLSQNIYEQDNLTYNTERTWTTPDPSPSTDGSAAALNPDKPLTLIIHDDMTSQQSNPVEAAICHTLAEDRHPKETFGIVTPHNAQRGLLSTAVTDADVDTVERYQGDQRDIITVSATAADPQFLHSESDFILAPNRLNVAMSRMKHKLLVTASSSVFTLMPQDVSVYDRAHLWKSLYQTCNVSAGEPTWSGTLDEFCSPATKQSQLEIPEDVSVEVYHQ